MDGITGHEHGAHGMDASDLFAQFFGGETGYGFSFGPGFGGKRRGKGADSVIPQEVTLEDLYNGKHVKMNVEKEVICGQCKGYGSKLCPFQCQPFFFRSGARGHAKPKPCTKCDGKGWTYLQSPVCVLTNTSPDLSFNILTRPGLLASQCPE
jgi:DnaJ family protein A protein 2